MCCKPLRIYSKRPFRLIDADRRGIIGIRCGPSFAPTHDELGSGTFLAPQLPLAPITHRSETDGLYGRISEKRYITLHSFRRLAGAVHFAPSRSLQSRHRRVQGTTSKRAREIGFPQASQVPKVSSLIRASASSIARRSRPSV